ncbi:MAG: N-acetyl-gamma-glutamyl-phosphate reductase [Candidatus Omnitrophica bacterium]|nr:N-acetyl-gamma-glutamyl-phosphate reductase [Candidatus Omnitrophota bacterium]MDE2221978.1 N-acetyl-gamma-glutamyl-phosphate reductase [Candidatus Omnitrophota bacterium]
MPNKELEYSSKTIRAGVWGVSGYTGREVLGLLLKHPGVRVTDVAANNTQGPVAEIFPEFLNRTTLVCHPFSIKETVKKCDVVFLALPHTESMKAAPKLLKAGLKVVDLSADYRLKKAQVYETWYGHRHVDTGNLNKAVYGLPELFRQKIKGAAFVANPGCYPTAAILGLAPLIATRKDIQSIVVDAKSGISGAGRKATVDKLFAEANGNFKAYKVLSHQHAPEIEQYLSQLAGRATSIHFVAHLLPITRGILNTMYVHLEEGITANQVHSLYKKFYKIEPFVRLHPLGRQPEIKNVANTNFCDIGLAVSPDKKLVVITSAIDNLVKGAAGQAVQNMNLMVGFNETEGLL